MYARVHNITNVGGRENYVKNKKDREEVVGFYNSASDDFWKLLAKENQEQFLRSTNVKRPGAKASEAREIIFGLPSYVSGEAAAKYLADTVKREIGMECIVAIHKKHTRNDKGEKVLNVHAHIIFAERELLPAPIHYEEKRAERNYYYNAAGKQCKKSEAVKVTKKGTITQEEHTRYFSNKKNFYNRKALEPLIDSFVKQFDFEKFDVERHFSQRHIGKNNPKEKFIKEYNELVKEMNSYFDKLDSERSDEAPAKEIFCEKFSVPQRFGINHIEEVKAFFEQFKDEIEYSEPAEVLLSELQVLRSEVAELEEDLHKTMFVLQTPADDFVNRKVANIYRHELQTKYNFFIDNHFLNYLKEKYFEVKNNITNIIEKLKKLKIDVPGIPKPAPQKEKEQER